MNVNLVEQLPLTLGTLASVTTNGGVTGTYISLKGAKRAWITVVLKQAVGHATVIQPQKATSVAGGGAASITAAVRIWANEDSAASDAEVRKTSATSYTVAADVKGKVVEIEIDPAEFTGAFDCLGCTISDSSQATNFVTIMYRREMGYSQATPPTASTD